jgi:uncharacterized protein
VGKIIFWIVVFFLVLLALRLLSVHKAKSDARDEKKASKNGDRDTARADDVMVRCASCGVFIPRAQSVMGKNGLSCGDANCERLTKK